YSSRRRRRCWASHSRNRSSFRCRGRRSLASAAAATAIGSRRLLRSTCILVSTSHVQPGHPAVDTLGVDVVAPTLLHEDRRPERELARPQSHAKELRINAHPGGGFGDRDLGHLAHLQCIFLRYTLGKKNLVHFLRREPVPLLDPPDLVLRKLALPGHLLGKRVLGDARCSRECHPVVPM